MIRKVDRTLFYLTMLIIGKRSKIKLMTVVFLKIGLRNTTFGRGPRVRETERNGGFPTSSTLTVWGLITLNSPPHVVVPIPFLQKSLISSTPDISRPLEICDMTLACYFSCTSIRKGVKRGFQNHTFANGCLGQLETDVTSEESQQMGIQNTIYPKR